MKSSESIIPPIPYDLYESPQEIVIIMPLGGVDKETLGIAIKDYRLIISGERKKSDFKQNLIPLKEECYRGSIEQSIDLPANVYFDKIHSKLSPENTLQIIVPKALIPEKLKVEVEYE